MSDFFHGGVAARDRNWSLGADGSAGHETDPRLSDIADAQCTLRMNAADFVDMAEGRANGQQLFFTGKLKIEGDMGLAMKLQQLTKLFTS